jgi:glycosyltransferase involved in cell wall biosynthesis
VARSRQEKLNTGALRMMDDANSLSVTYVVERLVIAGGVLSIIQLVNQLIVLGVRARIATLFEDPLIHGWAPLYTRPMVFTSARELIAETPVSDVVVATKWTTAAWVDAIAKRGKARNTAYFLQDYEPWFYPVEARRQRSRVIGTYRLVDNKIVKSRWLKDKLRETGYQSTIIHLGMNLDVFYPRPRNSVRKAVIAMARPGTRYRGFDQLLRILELLVEQRSDLEVILFGDAQLASHDLPFPYRDCGVISDQDEMAKLYSQADVFLDTSLFQGFGRCGLEAMACGTTCVLSGTGGVTEYAEDEVNCMLADPLDEASFARKVLSILENDALAQKLIDAGLETAAHFDQRREAVETLRLFKSISDSPEQAGMVG